MWMVVGHWTLTLHPVRHVVHLIADQLAHLADAAMDAIDVLMDASTVVAQYDDVVHDAVAEVGRVPNDPLKVVVAVAAAAAAVVVHHDHHFVVETVMMKPLDVANVGVVVESVIDVAYLELGWQQFL